MPMMLKTVCVHVQRRCWWTMTRELRTVQQSAIICTTLSIARSVDILHNRFLCPLRRVFSDLLENDLDNDGERRIRIRATTRNK